VFISLKDPSTSLEGVHKLPLRTPVGARRVTEAKGRRIGIKKGGKGGQEPADLHRHGGNGIRLKTDLCEGGSPYRLCAMI